MKTESTIHQRFKIVVEALGMKPPTLALEMGMKNANDSAKIYNIINGLTKPSWETINQLVTRFPEVNVVYLVKGEGEPLLSGNAKVLSLENQIKTVDIPLLPVSAYASFIETYSGNVVALEDTFPVHGFDLDLNTNGYLVIEVQGESMMPQIRDRMKLLIKKVDIGDWAYLTGIHVVLFKDFLVAKRIRKNTIILDGKLELYSDGDGSTMNIISDDIRAIWKVLRVVDYRFQ